MRSNRLRLIALFAVVVVVAAACGGGDGSSDDGGDDATAPAELDESTTTAPTTTAAIPEGGEALVELQIIAVDFGEAGAVTIENRSAEAADVNGIFICQFPTYVDLGTVIAGGTIAAGESAEVSAAALNGLSPEGGEAALYSTNADFDSPDNILAFVQWGTGGARSGVATEANIWPGADVSVTPDPAFNGIELFGDPADPESWG